MCGTEPARDKVPDSGKYLTIKDELCYLEAPLAVAPRLLCEVVEDFRCSLTLELESAIREPSWSNMSWNMALRLPLACSMVMTRIGGDLHRMFVEESFMLLAVDFWDEIEVERFADEFLLQTPFVFRGLLKAD